MPHKRPSRRQAWTAALVGINTKISRLTEQGTNAKRPVLTRATSATGTVGSKGGELWTTFIDL